MVRHASDETLLLPDLAVNDPEEQVLYEQIDEAIRHYQDHKGALIMVLHAAQEIYGFLPERLQLYISEKMGVPVSEVSGVVSFYSFFTAKKRGKHMIRVCQGTACYVRGRKQLVDAVKDELGIDVGDTTEDGLFSFELARCIGACGLAPAIMIDDDVFKQMTPHKLHVLLDEYRKENEAVEKNNDEETVIDAEGGVVS